jgi:hypothetical protein
VDDLADSRGLASDPAALAARLAADGYLLLRGLLPAERVRATGEMVAAALRGRHGCGRAPGRVRR